MNLNKKFKTKKGYSLVEIIVSLAIIGIILTILFNTLITTLRISFKTFARSFTREELSQVTTFVARDIRNSDSLNDCGSIAGSENCRLYIDGEIVDWSLCLSTRICKSVSQDGITFTNTYVSSPSVAISKVEFSSTFGVSDNPTRENILITIVGGHATQSLGISNIIRQQTVSTRNYEL